MGKSLLVALLALLSCRGRVPSDADDVVGEGEGEGEGDVVGEGEGDDNPCADIDDAVFDVDGIYAFGPFERGGALRAISDVDGHYAVDFDDGWVGPMRLGPDGRLRYLAQESDSTISVRTFVADEDRHVDNGDGVASRADCRYPGLPSDNDERVPVPPPCNFVSQTLNLFLPESGGFVVTCGDDIVDDRGQARQVPDARLRLMAVDVAGRRLFVDRNRIVVDDLDFELDGPVVAASADGDHFFLVTDVGRLRLLLLRDGAPQVLGDYPSDLDCLNATCVVDHQQRLFRFAPGFRIGIRGAPTSEILRFAVRPFVAVVR